MKKQTKSGAINGESARPHPGFFISLRQEWRSFKRELQAYSKLLIQSYQIFNVHSRKSNEKRKQISFIRERLFLNAKHRFPSENL